MTILTIKLRLRDKHSAALNRQAQAVNVVWNYCNETQAKAVKDGRKWLNFYDLARLTSGSSTMLGLHAHTIQKVCQQYDHSRQQHRRPWLRFRGRRALGWVPFNQGSVKLVGPGKLKFRGEIYRTMHWRDLPSDAVIRSGSFNRDARGRWYINMPIEFPDDALRRSAGGAVGIDLGIKNLAVLSTGESIASLRHYKAAEAKLRNSQRARKKRRVVAINAEIANARKDNLHKESARLASIYETIVVGDASVNWLTQTKMAKSVLDAGWSTFRNQLSYKAIRHGGRMIEVNERMTTQTCSTCGALPEGRPRGNAGLGIREWTCGDCGQVHDRDVNAARNILARGLASLEEGAQK